jgi:hypothetical protein
MAKVLFESVVDPGLEHTGMTNFLQTDAVLKTASV